MNKRKLFALTLCGTILSSSFVNIKVSGKEYSNSRLYGLNRFETSLNIAREVKNQNKDIKAVILANGYNFPDALSGSVLSKEYNAPILLIGNDTKNDTETFNLLKNLNKNTKIYILGGEGSIDKTTTEKVKSLGFTDIKRLGGINRYETSNIIAEELNINKGTPIVIASGEGFADALSISSIASINGYPILLSSKDSLSSSIKEQIKKIEPNEIYIVGGQGSISKSVENEIAKITGKIPTRIDGKNRYETSMNISKYFKLESENAILASGQNFPDALSGSALASKLHAPIILIDNNNFKEQKDYVDKTNYKSLYFLGGTGSINETIFNQFGNSTSNDKTENNNGSIDNIGNDKSLIMDDNMGNTPANYALHGAVVPVGNKYYFWNKSRIYSIEGNNVKYELDSRIGNEYNYYNGKLYGSNYLITGKEDMRITDNMGLKSVKIHNGYMYYLDNYSYELKRMLLDGSEEETIFKSEHVITNYYIYKDKLYFTGVKDKKLNTYCIDLNRIQDIKTINMPVKAIVDYVKDDKIYFTDMTNNKVRKLCKSNLDGTNMEVISDNLGGEIIPIGDWIYVIDFEEIGRLNEKTKKYEVLYKDGKIDISTVGFTKDKIVFSNLYKFEYINIMNFDGSDLEKKSL